MSKHNGGPAFPSTNIPIADIYGNDVSSGMTLRDYFAAAALPSILDESYRMSRDARAQIEGGIPALAAKFAYEFADAMLKERTRHDSDDT